MKKLILPILVVGLTVALLSGTDADAKGRKGSKRHGGSNSHGKGSHYRGGRK